jgi:hypothetical protein
MFRKIIDNIFFANINNNVSVNLPAYQLPSVHLPMMKLLTRTSPAFLIVRVSHQEHNYQTSIGSAKVSSSMV